MSTKRAEISLNNSGGEHSSNSGKSTGSNGGGRNSHARESSGTMQLLDRLGYGLVSVPSLDNEAGGGGEESVGRAALMGVGTCPEHVSRKEHERIVDDEPHSAQVNGMGFPPPPAGMICPMTSCSTFCRSAAFEVPQNSKYSAISI